MIHPLILCGGSGTRLWPLSRRSYPKQFTPFKSSLTLFQETVKRLTGEGFASPIIVTGDEYRFIVTNQLAEIGIDPGAILIEPEGRNTGPAVLAGVLHVAARDPDALILVAPSDHAIEKRSGILSAIEAGQTAAAAGELVTFGVTPDRPETGYGYLELAEESAPGSVVPLRRFVEKPDRKTAERMQQSGRHLWNAGIFLFSARTLLEAFERHAPALIKPVRDSLENATSDLGFTRLDPTAWEAAEAISLDYAIMEKADNLAAVPLGGSWTDLGDWSAVWRDQAREGDNVALGGRATAIECRHSLLRTESEAVELVGLGLENIIAVATSDAVLVADMSRAQDVKQVVAQLASDGCKQAHEFPREHRPWGSFDSLAVGDRFQVKRIVVDPGGALSLQSHAHRAEHWIVVEGTALATIGEEKKQVRENESVYIPLGTVHRLENPGEKPVVLIEVQTGSYLGEDDIERYDDVYARQ